MKTDSQSSDIYIIIAAVLGAVVTVVVILVFFIVIANHCRRTRREYDLSAGNVQSHWMETQLDRNFSLCMCICS